MKSTCPKFFFKKILITKKTTCNRTFRSSVDNTRSFSILFEVTTKKREELGNFIPYPCTLLNTCLDFDFFFSLFFVSFFFFNAINCSSFLSSSPIRFVFIEFFFNRIRLDARMLIDVLDIIDTVTSLSHPLTNYLQLFIWSTCDLCRNSRQLNIFVLESIFHLKNLQFAFNTNVFLWLNNIIWLNCSAFCWKDFGDIFFGYFFFIFLVKIYLD